jgi:large subunit ribosomal protein L21
MRNFSPGSLQPFISVSASIFGGKRSTITPALSVQSANLRPFASYTAFTAMPAFLRRTSTVFLTLSDVLMKPHCIALGHVAQRALHTQTPAAATNTLSSALSAVGSQPTRYVVAAVAGRKYLLAPRDLLTVPRLRDVNVGDVLALSEIHEVGSREFTLRGNPTIPAEQVKVEATVVEHTKGQMEVIFKKKRRKGYQRTTKHKQTYTRLRIGPIEVVEPVTTSVAELAA